MNRRRFSKLTSAAAAGFPMLRGSAHSADVPAAADEKELAALVDAHRPSRMTKLPADFRARVGATHVGGKYCLTKKPFLIEGAEKLIALGTRLGKFWFAPDRIAESYPFNSKWGKCRTYLELAQTDYFQETFAMPFETIFLEAHSPAERRWKEAGLGAGFYDEVADEMRELAGHLLKTYADREITFVLQNWEGDWMLRGEDKKWNPPPANHKEVCGRMQRWLAARQRGVNEARAAHAGKTKCTVAHAAEVNLVADGFRGIPTMTREVLPGVELDLVCYSSYDALHKGPRHFWNCLAEIRSHCRTGSLYGPGALSIGEIGFPENAGKSERPIAEMWDVWMGVLLAAKVRHIIHWELYCNEFTKGAEAARPPVTDPALMRGYWLVKPDGALSESGAYFAKLWRRAA